MNRLEPSESIILETREREMQRLNLKDLMKIILSEKSSLAFRKTHDFRGPMPPKKKAEKIKSYIALLIKQESIHSFIRRLTHLKCYIPDAVKRELERYLRSSTMVSKDSRRAVP